MPASTSRTSRKKLPRSRDDLDAIRQHAVAYLRKEQDADLQAFGVKFDVYYLESSLYTDGKVDETVKALVAERQDLREGRRAVAAHHRLRRRQGPRGAQVRRQLHLFRARRRLPRDQVAARLHARSIDVQGTDHHSTVTRVRAGLQALGLGIPAGYPDYVLHSLVQVMRGGEEVKISKRAGSYVTVRDLIDWVGRDAVRFFLVSRKADSEFVFDVDLAREKAWRTRCTTCSTRTRGFAASSRRDLLLRTRSTRTC